MMKGNAMPTGTDKLSIRKATMGDLELLSEIEAACFPVAEAATKERFEARLAAFSDHFLILQDDGHPVGFINGMVTREPYIEDIMFEKADLHCPDGSWQSIFGLDILPQYRCRGYAGKLIRAFIELAKTQGRRGLTLTCKEYLLHYYAKFGFVPLGVSESQHGGARWFDMVLEFNPAPTTRTPIKAVFFDLDGTLVDSVPVLTEAINRVMRNKGLREFLENEIAEMVGKGAKALIERVCVARHVELTSENVLQLLQAYAREMMSDELPEERFYAGAFESVEALHEKGFKTVLVTNKMRQVTEQFLRRSGLGRHLDALVAGDDTNHPKPAPDMLLLACEKVGVSPAEAVMVGDSENDAWAAKAAGMQAMLVSTGYNGGVPIGQWARTNGFSLIFDEVSGVKDYIFACERLLIQ